MATSKMLALITIIILAISIIILGISIAKSREHLRLEPFVPPVPKSVQNASLTPISAEMCNDYQFVHSTPGMKQWCRDIGTLGAIY